MEELIAWQVATVGPRNLNVSINVVNLTVSRAAARRSLLTAASLGTMAAATTRDHADNTGTEPMVRNLMVADTASWSRDANKKRTAPVAATEEITRDTEGSVTRSVAGIGLAGIRTMTTGILETADGRTVTGVRKGLGTKNLGLGTAKRYSDKVIRLRMVVATETSAANMVTRVDTTVVKVKVDIAAPLVSRTFPSAKRDVRHHGHHKRHHRGDENFD